MICGGPGGSYEAEDDEGASAGSYCVGVMPRISAITRFVDSGLLPHFGLPRTRPAGGNIRAGKAGAPAEE
jgi:hypothetical protein